MKEHGGYYITEYSYKNLQAFTRFFEKDMLIYVKVKIRDNESIIQDITDTLGVLYMLGSTYTVVVVIF